MENGDSSCVVSISTDNRAVDELSARIVAAAGVLSAATCSWLLLVAEFDARVGYLRANLASTAQWLTHACGIAHRTAVEHVRVARALAAHSRLAVEMGAGRLSYSHVRAISRVAQAGDDLIDNLIDAARYGTVAQLESLVRGLRTVEDNEAATDATDREYLKHRWTSQSAWQLTARLDPERGALVTSAVEAVARVEEISLPEALVRLAEIGLAALADGARSPRPLRGEERAAVVVHLDVSKLPAAAAAPARSRERARPFARLEKDGPGLPDHVAERLLCAGRVRTVLHDGADVLDVGRSHRLVTDRQYRALLIRDHGHCGHPGCPNTRGLQAHHVRHWLHGGRTDLNNLILLCERHHAGHHDGAFTIRARGRGRFRFLRPDGSDLAAPRCTGVVGAAERIARQYATVAPDAATPQWDGQRLDRRYAVAVLADHRHRDSH
jgi:hypothetical protein